MISNLPLNSVLDSLSITETNPSIELSVYVTVFNVTLSKLPNLKLKLGLVQVGSLTSAETDPPEKNSILMQYVSIGSMMVSLNNSSTGHGTRTLG